MFVFQLTALHAQGPRQTVRCDRPGPLRVPLPVPGRGGAGPGRRGPAARHVHGHGGAVRQQPRHLLRQVRGNVPKDKSLP